MLCMKKTILSSMNSSDKILKSIVYLFYLLLAYSGIQKLVHSETMRVNMAYSDLFIGDHVLVISYALPIIGLLGSLLFVLEYKKIRFVQITFTATFLLFYLIYNQLVWTKSGCQESCACTYLFSELGYWPNQSISLSIFLLLTINFIINEVKTKKSVRI